MYRYNSKLHASGQKGLLYLHIPKTAGSSVNDLFISQFNDDEVATHIESKKILGGTDSEELSNKFRYLSGHVPYPQLSKYLNLNDWWTLSTFRKPDEHVVSHISWVRLLAEEGQKERLKQHDEKIQEIARHLKILDLSSPDEIVKMIQWLEDNEVYLFHNTQTRYMCGGKQDFIIAPNLLNNALKNLDALDFVGITERLEEFCFLLSGSLGFDLHEGYMEKQNQNKYKFGIDLTDIDTRKALQPLIEYDQIIYTTARKRFVEDLHNFLAELEKSQYPRFSSVNLKALRRILLNSENK